jgi:hypothetical protein
MIEIQNRSGTQVQPAGFSPTEHAGVAEIENTPVVKRITVIDIGCVEGIL